MLRYLVADICRVTRDTVIIMEDIGQNNDLGGEGDWTGRTVEAYQGLFEGAGFQLRDVKFLNTKISRDWYGFVWPRYRRRFVGKHHEGDRINSLGWLLIGAPLIATRFLDHILPEDHAVSIDAAN